MNEIIKGGWGREGGGGGNRLPFGSLAARLLHSFTCTSNRDDDLIITRWISPIYKHKLVNYILLFFWAQGPGNIHQRDRRREGRNRKEERRREKETCKGEGKGEKKGKRRREGKGGEREKEEREKEERGERRRRGSTSYMLEGRGIDFEPAVDGSILEVKNRNNHMTNIIIAQYRIFVFHYYFTFRFAIILYHTFYYYLFPPHNPHSPNSPATIIQLIFYTSK